jgi:very-short-patch-repair endonuclease
MKKPKDLETVKHEFVEFMEDRTRRILDHCKKMTPIESIVFMTLIDLADCFGRYDLNFRPQVSIGKYTVDFLIEYSPLESSESCKKIIIECDGHDFHEKTKEQAAHDKKRDRHFIKLGYIVLRYTGSEIYKDRFKVWSDVEELLLPDKHKYSFGYGPEYEAMLKREFGN